MPKQGNPPSSRLPDKTPMPDGSNPLQDSLDELARISDDLVDSLEDALDPVAAAPATASPSMRATLDELDRHAEHEVDPSPRVEVQVGGDRGRDIDNHLDSLFTPPGEPEPNAASAEPEETPPAVEATPPAIEVEVVTELPAHQSAEELEGVIDLQEQALHAEPAPVAEETPELSAETDPVAELDLELTTSAGGANVVDPAALFESEPQVGVGGGGVEKKTGHSMRWLSAAAAVVALMGGGWWLWQSMPQPSSNSIRSAGFAPLRPASQTPRPATATAQTAVETPPPAAAAAPAPAANVVAVAKPAVEPDPVKPDPVKPDPVKPATSKVEPAPQRKASRRPSAAVHSANLTALLRGPSAEAERALIEPTPERNATLESSTVVQPDAVLGTIGPPPVPVQEPPTVLIRVDPVYPDRLSKRVPAGTIVLSVLVGEQGRPVRVVVEESGPAAELEAAAIDAVLHWVYSPATENGKAVRAWTRESFDYRPE